MSTLSSQLPPSLPALHLPAVDQTATRGQPFTQSYGNSFYDFKPYQIQDRPQQIYWKHYHKTGQLVVKQYEAYKQGHLCIIVDASASMGVDTVLWSKVCHTIHYIASSALKGGHMIHYLYERNEALNHLPSQHPKQTANTHHSNMHRLLHIKPQGKHVPLHQLFSIMQTFPAHTYFIHLSDFLRVDTQKFSHLPSRFPYYFFAAIFTQAAENIPPLKHILIDPERTDTEEVVDHRVHTSLLAKLRPQSSQDIPIQDKSSHPMRTWYKKLSHHYQQHTLRTKIKQHYQQVKADLQQHPSCDSQLISKEYTALQVFQKIHQCCESLSQSLSLRNF